MSPVLITSIVVRGIALVWSLVLLRRLRDWRMGFLSATLGLMALRQSLTLAQFQQLGIGSLTEEATELPGLAVSVLALLAVLFLERIITESREKDEALRESDALLRQSQKMEAIGRLAGGVAHDFNNFLTVILGYSEALIRRLDAGSEEQRSVTEIYRAGQRAAELTRQLLAVSRKQTFHYRLLDLNRSVSTLRDMFSRLIGEHIAFSIHLDPKAGLVYADAAQIEQVLLNLVVNARDAMPGGGTLEIAVDAVEFFDRGAEELGKKVVGPFVRVSVRDSGKGMDEPTQQRIFEPFFSTKESTEGTGLGLSTVFGIVKQSGGFIRVRSAPGQGSTFEVFFPRAQDVEAPSEEEARRSARVAEARSSRSVLLVEDEEAVREFCASALRSAGHRVLVATNGAEALGVARRHPGVIDVLLTDLVMLGMTGVELARRLVRDRPDVAVVYMSGYPKGTRDSTPELPPDAALITKPFTTRDLHEAIERAGASADAESR